MVVGPLASVTVTASPFTFTNSEAVRVCVAVSGGTVTSIDKSVDGSTSFFGLGLLGGEYHLNPGHSLKVTYVVAPTMNYHPI